MNWRNVFVKERSLFSSLISRICSIVAFISFLFVWSCFGQVKQSIQVKAFDPKLQPIKNIELSINGKAFFSVGNKGVVFIELENNELPIQTIRVKDEQLEPASWNFTKGVLEIIVRKKNYQLLHFKLKLPSGKPIAQAQVTFSGKKSLSVTTDSEGKFEIPVGIDERNVTMTQFEIRDYKIMKFDLSENILIADNAIPLPEKKAESNTLPTQAPEAFKDFDLTNLDSIQSITVFYAVFKNIAIQELNPNARKKIDLKFNQLVAKLQDSVSLKGNGFISSISDSSFVRDDIRNLLNQATVENKELQSNRSDFDSKIKIITSKLEKGIVNLNNQERSKLFSDLTLLERLLIDNESKFYRNQNDYRNIIDGLKEKYFDIKNLENKLSETEAKRLEDQQKFRQRLLVISLIVALFALMIVLLIYFSGRLRKQKKELVYANAEVKRINENLEGIVRQRTKLLEDANQELDTFLYRASHDLRSPVSSIIGLCNIALHLSPGELVEKVKLTTRSMDHLLRKLRMISEINRSTEYSSVSLIDMTQKVINRFKAEIANQQIEFVMDCPSQIVLNTYPDLVEIILSNLIENAVFFSTMGGRSNARVEFKAKVKQGNVEFSIYDNGVGVDKAIRPKLFGMFFKGHEKSLGNGLGLYIVQKSVQALHGKIVMESEANLYTRFVVQLPLNLKAKTLALPELNVN